MVFSRRVGEICSPYHLTRTDFEGDLPEAGKRRYGYRRDRRPDCVPVVIALVIPPEGRPIAYEVMAGHPSAKTTRKSFLEKIEPQDGKIPRTWVMDRGIPTEEVLQEMRQSSPPVCYWVGTPRGRLTRLERDFLQQPWAQVKDSLEVKRLAREGELSLLTRSQGRRQKERGLGRRRLRRLWQRLQELQPQKLSRDELVQKRGAAKADVGIRSRLVEIRVPLPQEEGNAQTFTFSWRKEKLRAAMRHEGQ